MQDRLTKEPYLDIFQQISIYKVYNKNKKNMKNFIDFLELISILILLAIDWIFKEMLSLSKKVFHWTKKQLMSIQIISIWLILCIYAYCKKNALQWMQRLNKSIVIVCFFAAIILTIKISFEFFNQTEHSWLLFGNLIALIALLYFGFQNKKDFY